MPRGFTLQAVLLLGDTLARWSYLMRAIVWRRTSAFECESGVSLRRQRAMLIARPHVEKDVYCTIMKDFVEAIPAAGASPLAFAAYAMLIFAWTVITLNIWRTGKLFRAVKDLPESERVKAISLEYRTAPARGLSAAQWLRAQRSKQLLFGFFATLVCIIVLVALVLQYKSIRTAQAMQEYIIVSDARGQALLRELEIVEVNVPRRAGEIKPLREEIARLLEARMIALRSGNLVVAQDAANRIAVLYAIAQVGDGPQLLQAMQESSSLDALSENPDEVVTGVKLVSLGTR